MTDKANTQREIIKKSHKRCEEYGVDKEQVYPGKILTGNEVQTHLASNEYLLKIAIPFMEIIYESVANSGFFILLTDREGCILKAVGDPEIIAESERLNMVVGAYMNEKYIGTNAMGTAISENQPIQVTAQEHFISAYHRWTCSAAPIHNNQEEIIGTLNLTGESHLVHPHTLGLIVAAVRAIENQIKADYAQDKLNEAFSYMKSIVESVSSGIMALDLCGNIKTINNWALSMLNLKKEKIINHPVDKLLPHWREIIERFRRGETYMDMETTFSLNGNKEKYDLSAYPILGSNQNIIGMVLVIKGMQKIYNLVNKYTGMRAHYTFEDIIGDSAEFSQVIQHAEKISGSTSTVLLMGESGTGKELIAQSIHNASPRRNSVFIAVNCGALPKDLIESELFGFEEGAFTGSKKGGHAGKFELANGGTIFLDEIGEMPLDMQVNLLRVLQEGYVTRIGGSKNITVDVRVIAATKKNLIEELKKGTFREDLFYRLSVIPLFIPPLRERGKDKKTLFDYFLKFKAQKLNKPLPGISQKLFDQIMTYDWPGNVRELENYVENLVNFNGTSSFDIINPTKNNQISTERPYLYYDKSHNKTTGYDYADEEMTLEEMEKQTIRECFQRLDGNISQVSRRLGISRTTLYSKMRKYNLSFN
jgi:sigma-54 dependent transcriptional regulator, acetoin dehydrogenase operon transcriptional activator AcoR